MKVRGLSEIGGILSVSLQRRRRPPILRESAQGWPVEARGVVAVAAHNGRPRVDGKFIAVGDRRLNVCGVTYGTFAPDAAGCRFPRPDVVERDFAAMTQSGINAVRTYTEPPLWLLDAALRHGLWVMVGLPWEQHVAFLRERSRRRSIEARVRELAAGCAGHPALLCFAVGNEIPTPIVRWHGRGRVEAFLERLCDGVRAEDAGALVTYVNYPSTEYLRLPFVDVVSFNLYLDDIANVRRYLARLQNLAGERPLVLAEVGSDSRHEGLERHAVAVGNQVTAAFAAGCAGTFVFSWTDEWHRGQDEVLDWDFGVTDRARRPKPALAALRDAYTTGGQMAEDAARVSVVVCTYNGSATLRACMEGLMDLNHPDFEVIVVDDGSTDTCSEIACEYDVRLIRTENRGLSAARNTGLAAATGEIVAYIDDDAVCDRDWLRFLDSVFATTDYAAVGGPNVPPRDEGAIATCVASSPGGPVHVLVSDMEAEHIPGCNMAFRRNDLLAIGGFDPQFRAAGDDVDACWRLQERGQRLGFHPTAVVWHRRRDSVRRYWRQQQGYGRAEALLERKWPERYNRRGHVTWTGRIYDRASASLGRPSRIYHGTWGTGAFQPQEDGAPSVIAELARTPEWYMGVGLIAGLSALGLLWSTLLVVLPLLTLGVAIPVALAAAAGARADLGRYRASRLRRFGMRLVIAALHAAQPAARLTGRLSQGLAPWRRSRSSGLAVPRTRSTTRWFEHWQAPQERVARIEATARRAGARVSRGGPYDRWDLEITGGAGGGIRLLVAVEDHGRGRQLLRCRMWPTVPPLVSRLAVGLALLSGCADRAGQPVAALGVALLLLGMGAIAMWECAMASACGLAALDGASGSEVTQRDHGALRGLRLRDAWLEDA
jgi:O-antigen biosynthesis protein